MSDTWTVAQAAMIIEKPLHLLQRVVERAPVKPARAQRGGRRVYLFEMRDLIFFCALDDLKAGVTNAKQVELYKALKGMPDNVAISSVEAGSLKYDFRPYVRRVKRKIEETGKLFKLIDATGDEPVIRGTDVSAYRIAALQDGMAVAEIIQDYPSLNEQQVFAAKAYSESHPKAGRPYPKITAKKAMREAGADFEDFMPIRA